MQRLPGGAWLSGFFTADFTLAEVQSLWAVQALPFRDASHNQQHRRALSAQVVFPRQLKGALDTGLPAHVTGC